MNSRTTFANTAIVPYTTLIRRFSAAPPGKLYCLHGGTGVYRLSLYAAAHALLRGTTVTVVDGSNRFDLYYVADFARNIAGKHTGRKRMTPEEMLKHVFISRAFTCYQMEAVITDRLLEFVRKMHSPVVLIFGLLDTFYDEQAPLFEVNKSVGRIIAALQRLKAENISVLLASQDVKLESRERNALFPRVAAAMDQTVRLLEGPEGIQLASDRTLVRKNSEEYPTTK